MKAVISLLLGIAFGAIDQNPYSALDMATSWQQEITFDWENLDHATAFENWKQTFNKQYDGLEAEATAFITFLDNWKMINEFNIADQRSFTLRMNQFSDMTSDQFKLYIHGHSGSCVKPRSVEQRIAMKPVILDAEAVPDSIDWTNNDGKSYVTPVKNQGQCGSCWAFSTTGSIESRTAIKNGQTGSEITSLSEQQLVGTYCIVRSFIKCCYHSFPYAKSHGSLYHDNDIICTLYIAHQTGFMIGNNFVLYLCL